ncbi:FKBP-type peptidyl-prolyl cis-trans isomerase [Erythrobacter rubeus]|uniref:Peptidyl-prolyl cis-trans isomerase n=1 Tax=Erythrobacter rubeus TaxID=2760803 RepID=A0ABR8KWR6_9SPHN|nr:FKBP-type peptidyl-prolyl cis-trans isomerase [Erythrobacter rubeus]MBD2842581.1 FKBP-type peptidyl-prolyl cis-trans isomerase [Erythrobacter rubeus]
MTEVTRVPIKPVAAGSLTKLWLGVALAILLGGGLAWAAMPKGLDIDTIQAGEGPSPSIGDVAFVKYVGKLASTGETFDESQDIPLPIQGLFPEGTPFPIEEGATIDGFFTSLQQMQKGGKYEVYIPAAQAYGAEPPPGAPIPPNADLIFEIEMVDFLSKETFDRNLQILQQTLQQRGPGGPSGPGGPAQNVPGNQPPPVPIPGN